VSDAKQHHYIPEAFQARFADSAGRLHHFSRVRPELGVGYTTPNNLFKKNHLYSVTDAAGLRAAPFETELSTIEGRASLLVAKIVASARAGRKPGLSLVERNLWDRYFLLQWRRVPEVHRQSSVLENAEGEVLDLLAEFRQRWPNRGDEIDALSTAAEVKRLAQNARVDALAREMPEARAALAGRGLAIVHITDPRRSFILGSLPVVKLTKPGCTDLRDFEVEMWMPVSSDTMVGVGLLPGTELYIPTRDIRMIRAINTAITSQSAIIAGRSGVQIRSLASHAPRWSAAPRAQVIAG
jgi:hypothetical protein